MAPQHSEWSERAFDDSMNVHLYGPMSLIDGLMGSFRKGTRIINVSSEYGQLANLSEAYRAAIQAVEDPYVITTVQARGGIQGLRVVGSIPQLRLLPCHQV